MLSSVYNLEIGENSRIELNKLFLSVIHSIHILSGMKANLVIGTTEVAKDMSDFVDLDFPLYECISTFCLDFGGRVGGCIDVLIFYSNDLKLTDEERSFQIFGGGFSETGPGVPKFGPGGAAGKKGEEDEEEGEEEGEKGDGPNFGEGGPNFEKDGFSLEGGKLNFGEGLSFGEQELLIQKFLKKGYEQRAQILGDYIQKSGEVPEGGPGGGVGKNLVISRLSGKFFEGKPYVLIGGVFGEEEEEKGKDPIVTWFADQGEGVHLRDLEVKGIGKLRVVSVDSINRGDYEAFPEAFPDRRGTRADVVGLAGLYLLCLINRSETLGDGVCDAACITDGGRDGVWPVKYRRDHRVCFNFAKGADIYEIVMEEGGGEGEGVFIFGQGIEGGKDGKRVELGVRGDGTRFVLFNGISFCGGVQNLEFSETLARKIKEVNYIYLQAKERVKVAHLGETFLTVVEN
jgi:hypothetical protein